MTRRKKLYAGEHDTEKKEQGKRRDMKQWLLYFFGALLLLVTLFLALYPTISNRLAEKIHEQTIRNYNEAVSDMFTQDYADIWNAVEEYNYQLSHTGNSNMNLISGEPEGSLYQSLLNVDGAGMMGYLEIPSIEVCLPIYHGTGTASLAAGVGHLEGSSLPAGGTGTHAVLSSHSGYPTAELFTNLYKLEIGDVFIIYVLDRTLVYEVDSIKTVIPSDTSSMVFEENKDYVTLFTCTPYGINSHRLLVRGVRVED